MSNLHHSKTRTLTIAKTFEAPRTLVWKAWTDPGHILKWWAPEGMAVTIITHEFRPGGHWKYALEMPDGSVFLSEGIYTAIAEPEKIVKSASFGNLTGEVTIQILFEEQDGKTFFTFSVIHPTEDACLRQKKTGFFNGWDVVLGRVEKLLREMEKPQQPY